MSPESCVAWPPATATKTVWVCAGTPDSAITALLNGERVYDTEELAVRMTGRLPVEVKIVAVIKSPYVVSHGS